MRVLALDFDGVISDSGAEAFVVALRTYLQLTPVPGWDDLGERVRGCSRGALDHEPLYRAFLALMPLGNRAEDFGVVLHALDAGALIANQDEYDRYREAVGSRFLERYHERFYHERLAFRSTDLDGWLSLLGPYPDFIKLLRRRSGDVHLAVATAKDRGSVDLLLDAYGIGDLFDEMSVLDKEAGPDKRAHVTLLAERLSAAPAEITFIDDKVNHLDSVSLLGVRCGLATWGFNGPTEHAQARERGYLVLTLEDVEGTLFGDRS